MKLLNKILLVSAIILAVLVTVLTVLSALSLRQFSIYTAERHARSVAETIGADAAAAPVPAARASDARVRLPIFESGDGSS